MIFFIIGVLAALVALAVLLLSEEGKAAAFIPGVVAVILIGVSCVSYVPTGYTGIVTTFGKVEDGTKDAGVIFIGEIGGSAGDNLIPMVRIVFTHGLYLLFVSW